MTNPNTGVENEVTLKDCQVFSMSMDHMDAAGHTMNLTFSLMQYHKYSLTEIENMIPFERDIPMLYF